MTARSGERGELVDRMVKTLTQGANSKSPKEPSLEPSDDHTKELNAQSANKLIPINSAANKNTRTSMMRIIKQTSNANRTNRNDPVGQSRINNTDTTVKMIQSRNQDLKLQTKTDDFSEDSDDKEEQDEEDASNRMARQRADLRATNRLVASTGAKLVMGSNVEHSNNRHLHGHHQSQKHQPHCIHHNPNCHKHQSNQQNHHHHHHHHQDERQSLAQAPPKRQLEFDRRRPIKQSKEQPYLLVEYRQPGKHLNELGPGQATKANKRTTLSFISQLYFLLHLSAILSLLLHHKNLVTSDRKLAQQQQQQNHWSRDLTTNLDQAQAPNHRFTNNGTTMAPPWTSADLSASEIAPTIQPLPVPQAQRHEYRHIDNNNSNNKNNYHLGPDSMDRSGLNNNRAIRQVDSAATPPMPIHSDILVRLVGLWHAKHALQYFLCYLLSSSVTILLCLWLFRLCDGRKTMIVNTSSNSANNAAMSLHEADRCSARRTYLDCTPVLIGSISLGLIQLIVIGLDIAANIDWLSDARWPIYLPFLQFAFVSLLMQFILAQVAKNHAGQQERQRRFLAMPINERPTQALPESGFSLSSPSLLPHQQPLISAVSPTSGARSAPVATPLSAPISNGLQNIALAHLLVTHILLWLMRLNSITLFQPIEQNSPPSSSPAPSPSSVVASSPANHLFGVPNNHHHHHHIGLQGTTQPSGGHHIVPASGVNNTATTNLRLSPHHESNGANQTPTLPNSASLNEQHSETLFNRTEMEAILRRKFPRVESTRPPPPIHSVSTTRIPKPVDSSDRSANLGLDKGKFPTDSADALSAPVKNERGLRSTSGLPKPSTESPTGAAHGLNLTQLGSVPHNSTPNLVKNNDSFTFTQAQLLDLINLATKAKHEQPTVSPPPIVNVVQTSEPKKPSNISTNFKSSVTVPKRTTIFRQKPESTFSVVPTSGLPIVQLGKTNVPTPIVTSKPTVFTSTSASIATPTTERPRVRPRITVSRLPYDLTKVIPVPPSDERQPRAFQMNSSIEAVIASTERPFPSVESDPPLEKTGQERGRGAEKEHKGRNEGTPPADSRGSLVVAPIVESTTMADAETTTENDDESSTGDDSEDTEINLDALLPPVPNYNDTNEQDASTTTTKPEDDDEILRAAKLLSGADSEDGNSTAAKVAPTIQEEPFVFNEAASVSLDVTTTAPDLPSINLTIKFSNASSEPSSEALVMHQHQGYDKLNQPSFADYLLPIVHQYHILVIAILFHMWLDSLCQRSTNHARGKSRDQSDSRSPQDLNEFSSGLSTQASGSKRLIAIPIGPDGRPRLKIGEGPLGEQKLIASNISHYSMGLASKRDHLNPSKWHHLNSAINYQRCKSRSVDHLNQDRAFGEELALDQSGSSSPDSPRPSLRSSSSEQLLWVPELKSMPAHHSAGHKSQAAIFKRRLRVSSGDSSGASDHYGDYRGRFSRLGNLERAKLRLDSRPQPAAATTSTNSACSVFFGLLIVSASLIVMLLGIELLSMLTQCFTQLLSILACLIGLCMVWRAPKEKCRLSIENGRNKPVESAHQCHGKKTSYAIGIDHRQCFNYLFLLAAYYCGLSTALNLGRQNSIQQLFPQQVVQFVQRHVVTNGPHHLLMFNFARHPPDLAPLATVNFQLLFHAVVAIKGFILVLQVTLQTMLIRSSCRKATRDNGGGKLELRQIYTFLMFANLSLWALDICEQQRHLQHDLVSSQFELEANFELITLDGFTRFANSIVTLSHLYHGLVFLQQ